MRFQGKQYPKYGDMIKGYKYAGPLSFNPQYGHLDSGSIPGECINACSASGAVDDAVEYWRKALNLSAVLEPVRPLVERYLKEFGAWDDLATADIDTLANRVLWSACRDIAEQGEWIGLCH